MAKIEWHRPSDQTFQAGLDRGVIYVDGGPVVPWNGLSSVSDSGESTAKEMYLDGIKFLAVVSPRDWKGSLEAYSFPDEFAELIGISELAEGFYADSQAPDRFNLSYRTMITAPNESDKKHYKIHLVYKVVASLSEFSNATLGDSIDPVSFSFDLFATPVRVPGRRPTAHLIIDSRNIEDSLLKDIEDLIYGNDNQDPVFPDVNTLIDMLSFSKDVVVVYNGDGTWTATGSRANIKMLDNKGHFQIKNSPAEFISEDIYEFFGTESVAILSVALDTDGVPYFVWSDSTTNIGIDTDGVPYVATGISGASLLTDTDGTPYVEFS